MNITAFIEEIRNRIANGENFDYEAMLESSYRRWIKPGESAIDIGAHRGRHLAPILESVGPNGHVLAFEPLPFAMEILQKQFAYPNVTLINAAVCPVVGKSSFIFAQGTPEESGLRQRIYNRPDLADPITIEVSTTRVDDHTTNIDRISFIKIDVEGGEIGCLKSAEKTIAIHRPVISVEYGRPSYDAYGSSKDSIYHIANDLQMKIFDIFLNDLSDKNDWMSACDTVYWDYFLVPVEKTEQFLSRCRG